MSRLLKFNLRKLFMRKTTYIFLAVLVAMLIITEGINKVMYSAFEGDMAVLLGPVPDSGVKFLLAALSIGNVALILGIFVSLFACEDRNNDVLKNIYARGYTPTQTLFAELICIALYATVFTVVGWLAGFILGLAFFGNAGQFAGGAVPLLLLQLLCIWAYCATFFTFSKLLKKMGAVLAVNITAPVGIELIFSLVVIILTSNDIEASNYSIGGILNIASSLDSTNKQLIISFILAAVYCAAFVVAAWAINRKRAA